MKKPINFYTQDTVSSTQPPSLCSKSFGAPKGLPHIACGAACVVMLPHGVSGLLGAAEAHELLRGLVQRRGGARARNLIYNVY